jgi:hypothetical protein
MLETLAPGFHRELPPCTETILSEDDPIQSGIICSAHNRIPSYHLDQTGSARNTNGTYAPLNAVAIAGTSAGLHPHPSGQTLRWPRPETHQNLIHPDKEHAPQ